MASIDMTGTPMNPKQDLAESREENAVRLSGFTEWRNSPKESFSQSEDGVMGFRSGATVPRAEMRKKR